MGRAQARQRRSETHHSKLGACGDGFRCALPILRQAVIASEAKQSSLCRSLDCFVAMLLAMTEFYLIGATTLGFFHADTSTFFDSIPVST